MDIPEKMKGLDSKNERSKEIEEIEGEDKRRQRSSKSRKSGNGEEYEGSDSRNENRKRTSGTSRGEYEDDDYKPRKESRSKQEENNTLQKLSSWYEEGEKHEKRCEGEREKSASKFADNANNDEVPREKDIDSIYLEKNLIVRDKNHESPEQGRKKRDDLDIIKNNEEVKIVENLDLIKHESVGDINMLEGADGKIRGLDSPKGQMEQRSSVNRKDFDTGERSFNEIENSYWERDRERRETSHSDRSKSPERGNFANKKELEKEGYRDDRSKGREYNREWEVGNRHGRDYERFQSRSGGRKEISNVIEIQTKPFDRRNEPIQQSETKSGNNDDLSSNRFSEDGHSLRDRNSWKDDDEFHDGKIKGPRNNSNNSMSNRNAMQGSRGGWSKASGRDNQPPPYGMPMPMMGSHFGPIGMPSPGPMLPMNPNLSPISPGIFMPPFPPPLVWPGARGLDMNLLAVPPGLSPAPPGSLGHGFPSNLGHPANPALFFNQPPLSRLEPPNISSPGINTMVPIGIGQNQFPSRTNRPPGKAPSRGEQNDYSQNFVDTGTRPQNFIRELELTAVVEDYPKLRELIQKKDEIVANATTAPMYYKCDLREHVLSPEFFGTKFDVILVDPPWEEYVHRAPGVTDHMDYWAFEEIMNLKIEAIADTPSFIFLWVGDGVGLEQGRQCLKKWGFRRCEDICWVKTNKTNATPGLRHDSHTLFQRSKEHCLMGIKGTVRRSTDGHVIHANIDTDVVIAEEPPYGSTAKPEDMYRIIEHFALGRRRLELFGEDHNIRSGWLTLGKDLSSSNFNVEGYIRDFTDKDGKVWQGSGGRNPPPGAPHLIVTTPDIESLRPKSPMKNQQQLQQQSTTISINTTMNNSINIMPTFNQEAASSSSFQNSLGNDDRVFDMYGYNMNRNS